MACFNHFACNLLCYCRMYPPEDLSPTVVHQWICCSWLEERKTIKVSSTVEILKLSLSLQNKNLISTQETMSYLIVTCRSLLWMLVSIGIVVMHVFALITPEWLHRQDKSFLSALVSSTPSTTTLNVTQSNGPDSIIFRQSSALGLLTRCSETYSVNPAIVLAADGVANITEDCEWIRNFSELPIWLWKVTVVFYCLGVVILALVGVIAVFSLCFKSICRKSLFTVCGLVQAIAGEAPPVFLAFKNISVAPTPRGDFTKS